MRYDAPHTRTCLYSVGLLLGGCASSVATTHYVGVFDPQRQVTQELYRITIQGYAPWFSNMQFGTGWASAVAADLLDGRIALPPAGDGRKEAAPPVGAGGAGAGAANPATRSAAGASSSNTPDEVA